MGDHGAGKDGKTYIGDGNTIFSGGYHGVKKDEMQLLGGAGLGRVTRVTRFVDDLIPVLLDLGGQVIKDCLGTLSGGADHGEDAVGPCRVVGSGFAREEVRGGG